MLKIDTQYKDMHILESLRLAFTRPAFSTQFKFENNIKDFIQAIIDTQEFMNTGKLRNRNGEYISGSFSYKLLPELSNIKDGDSICIFLQSIRNYINYSIKQGDIRHCNDECYCVANHQVEIKLDELRKNIFMALNRIFLRNKQQEIKIPY